MNIPPDEHDLQAYVDGQLDGDARAAVERYLALHPERAEQVKQWRQDAQRLRAALESVRMPDDNPALDPAAIRARRAERTRMRFAMAASFVFCIGLGTFGGWQARGWNAPPAVAPMSDAVEAYRMMVVDRAAKVDFKPSSAGELQAWLTTRVGKSAVLPDLSAAGFRPVGGRLFATGHGAAAMVLYQDDAGRTLSFYLRPPESAQRLMAAGERVDGQLLARYGSVNGMNFAVVGPADSLAEKAVVRVLDQQT
ncbi:anti-sigma factor family protein [Burkholderia dolosa]|jgi:anti-sigma factor RsiW|uniref:anti-sigma factor family protein n=1 Tax=Burkholderia dolosa TaxID=152500 RepID=UPI001590FD5B|nr:anti-sigma factor [Burkholderia dolosa]MBR8056320.1 anti-sigma factor [Burkholderia dolosa]MBR8300428.1 anti-sigma factor [Burkholderia dolosa]MBR8312499.1 anti-sigma factor [Burkholderia dolosa]MBR8460665.1 anti-sigma factor [Burkholderia dolosa]MBY4750966.1 anti-sigma factor [Burkholderia dolosa]